jgi:N-methylhydantoinase B
MFFRAMHSGMAPGAIPASPGRDGIDTGGQDWVPGMEASNVEDNEMSWPVLTLFRRENRADAAGAGLYRSGVGAEEAWILHGTDTLDTQVYNNESFVKCQGLLGGNPGGRAFFRVKRHSDVAARLGAGTIPRTVDEVSGEEIPLYWKGRPVELDKDSVWTLNLPNFAGYGDPLDRDSAAVSRDLSEGQMTVVDAFRVYGVIADDAAVVDTEKTEAERADRRRQRLDGSLPAREVRGLAEQLGGSERRAISHKLGAIQTAGGARYACTCGQDLGPVDVDFKGSCVVKESPVDSIGPGYVAFAVDIMEKMCFREFYCPRCGARLATEVVRRGDDYLWDIELRV